MWKQILTFVFLVLSLCGKSRASSTDPAIDKATVRKAITIFRQSPANQQGNMVRPIILRFAHESPDVMINFSPRFLPWLEDSKAREEAGAVLLTAYVAGNVQSQLEKRKSKDDPVAGTEQVIATYRQLQKTEPQLKIAEVEKLIELQRQGKLAKHLEASPR